MRARIIFSFECIKTLEECGDDGTKATPVPMPNTEVKLCHVDGSWEFLPARVDSRHANWRFSSVGRAFALQAKGQRFEPVNLHMNH